MENSGQTSGRKKEKNRKEKAGKVNLSLKVEDELVTKIDAWGQQAAQDVPVLGKVTRTDVIKMLLRYALGLKPGKVIAANLRSA